MGFFVLYYSLLIIQYSLRTDFCVINNEKLRLISLVVILSKNNVAKFTLISVDLKIKKCYYITV